MGTPLHWIAFNLFIAIAIALDLRVFHRRPHKIEIREAALASFGWIAVSVLFGFGVLYFYGEQLALEFFTGYLIEKALSVDNLFLLLVVEITDVTLAVDSIPAVFGITRNPFIVYTSNVFAILGLRALYFLLAGVIDRLRFLDEGLAVVLVFIGGKMIGEQWVHIPETVSLGVVGGVLLIALLASVLIPGKKNT